MAPWARVVVQVLMAGGQAFANAFAKAYQQAAQQSARGGNAAMKETANRVLGRMSREEALKVLNLEGKQLTPQLVTKQFETIFKANSIDQAPKGSYYIQCKAEHAKNTLHDYIFSEEFENENNINNNENNDTNTNENINESSNTNENENENKNENETNENRDNKTQFSHSSMLFLGSFMIVASMDCDNEEKWRNRICFY